jgi:hypothetical protein
MKHLNTCFCYSAKEFPVQFRPPGDDEVRYVLYLSSLGRRGLYQLPEAKRRDKAKAAGKRRWYFVYTVLF